MAHSNHTPISIPSIQNSYNHIKVKTLSRSFFNLKFDKVNLIFMISFIFFLASAGFWGYVTFYMAQGG